MKLTESQRKSQKKYREKNKEKYNSYMKDLMLLYQRNNKETINIKQNKKNAFLRECKIFRSILFV